MVFYGRSFHPGTVCSSGISGRDGLLGSGGSYGGHGLAGSGITVFLVLFRVWTADAAFYKDRGGSFHPVQVYGRGEFPASGRGSSAVVQDAEGDFSRGRRRTFGLCRGRRDAVCILDCLCRDYPDGSAADIPVCAGGMGNGQTAAASGRPGMAASGCGCRLYVHGAYADCRNCPGHYFVHGSGGVSAEKRGGSGRQVVVFSVCPYSVFSGGSRD